MKYFTCWCNVRPGSSSIPDVGTRTQEILPVGEASEQKNASAEGKGKWKKFPSKRWNRRSFLPLV
jgi:hypothetical protein